MKTLILVRHAKSSWEQPQRADRDRPLAKRGRHALRHMSECLARRDLRPDVILSSPALRALATAEAMAEALQGRHRSLLTDEALYQGTVEGAIALLAGLDDAVETAMLVGHNPELSELLRRFAAGAEDLPTCAVASLSFDIEHWSALAGSPPIGLRLDLPGRGERGHRQVAERGPADLEVALRFDLPAEHLAGVRRALARPAARSTRLRSLFFDTADGRLAAAGIELSLEHREGRWAQVLRLPAEGPLGAPTHRAAIGGEPGTAPAQDTMPALDLGRHAGTRLMAPLRAALAGKSPEPRPCGEADLVRTRRVMPSQGARVGVSLEIGVLHAGGAQAPVHGLCFELESGPMAGLLSLAAHWVPRHGLWLEWRSLSQRCQCLGERGQPAITSRPLRLKRHMPADAALRAMVADCLAQILPNLAELAAGGAAEARTLHQLRIGLRRLRSALREFGDWAPDLVPGWRAGLTRLFAALGSARDLDALAETLLPQLQAAGAPGLRLPAGTAGPALTEILRAPATSLLLLELMGFAQREPEPGKAAAQQASLPSLAGKRLERLHRRLVKDATSYETGDDAARHATRKRLKRLRYCAEFVASLYGSGQARRYLARLREAADALGHYNDLRVAEDLFRAQATHDAHAWFALGWVAAQRPQLLAQAARTLGRINKVTPFWRD